MKVRNMENEKGNKIVNQFLITGEENGFQVEVFQSYGATIAKKLYQNHKLIIYLDESRWDYSTTTGKYRNLFLGETKKETEKKIASGEYILTNLN